MCNDNTMKIMNALQRDMDKRTQDIMKRRKRLSVTGSNQEGFMENGKDL